MSESLENLSIQDLQNHFDYVEKLLNEKKNAIRESTVSQLEEIAKSAGIAISIKPPKGQRKKRGENSGENANDIMYRHPQKDLSWNGVGNTPSWLTSIAKKMNKDISEFRVQAQQAES
jgi:DNA-binding protein H-NS